jgi:hypothetical protein
MPLKTIKPRLAATRMYGAKPQPNEIDTYYRSRGWLALRVYPSARYVVCVCPVVLPGAGKKSERLTVSAFFGQATKRLSSFLETFHAAERNARHLAALNVVRVQRARSLYNRKCVAGSAEIEQRLAGDAQRLEFQGPVRGFISQDQNVSGPLLSRCNPHATLPGLEFMPELIDLPNL